MLREQIKTGDRVTIRVERQRPTVLLQPPLQEIEMRWHVVGGVCEPSAGR